MRILANHYKMNYMAHFLRGGGNSLRERSRGIKPLLLLLIGLRNKGKKRLAVDILRGTKKQEWPAGFSLKQREQWFSKTDTNLYFNIKPKRY